MTDCFRAPEFRQASIAFDLDGTLVDTAPDLVRALNAVVEPCGLPPVDTADVREMVGRGARALIERSFSRSDISLDDEEAMAHVGRFIEVYRADIAAESLPFPGVVDTLTRLHDAGAVLSVCTNKPSVLADALLEALNLSRFFSRTIGPERTTAKKPAADHLHAALGTGHAHTAMVGDSAPDVDAAKAAGVPAVVMSYGYSEKPADSLGADRLIHSFTDLPEALIDLWRAGAC